MKNRFPGKKSPSFGIFLIISSFVIIFTAFVIPLLSKDLIQAGQMIVASLIVFPIIVLFVWCWLTTFYIIDKNILFCVFGPFIFSVPIMNISAIRLNQKTIGGTWKLTLSWNSIEIKYKKNRSVFISPERQDEFLKQLKELNNKIEIKEK